MLTHVLSRIHFDQPPERVLDYLSTPKFWPDWHVQSRRIQGGPSGPLQMGDRVIEYIAVSEKDLAAVEWTVADRWQSKMFRIEGRIVLNGVVQKDVVSAIHYALFPTEDGGTDFTREIELVFPVADLDGFKKLQDKSLANVMKILGQSK